MEQQRNACPTRRGSGHLDETTGHAAVGYERAMIEFIRRWHRFGGGSARDIFREFGLAERVFFRRTLELLQTRPFAGIEDEPADYLCNVCGLRLSAVYHW